MVTRFARMVIAAGAIFGFLAATALAQFATTQNFDPRNTQPAIAVAASPVPVSAVLPPYPPEFEQANVPQQQDSPRSSQPAPVVDRSANRSYGAASAADVPQYYRGAEADPSWIVRPQTTAVAAPNPGVEKSSGYAFSSDGRSGEGQILGSHPPLEVAPARLANNATARFINASTAGEGMPSAAPPPPDSSNVPGAAQGEANTSAGSGPCAACNGSGCNSCSSCDSCNSCNACDSCDGDCCHKLFPLFQIDDCCPLVCDEPPVHRALGDCCWLQCHDLAISGFVDGGIMANGRSTDDHFNGPLTFPDRRDEGQANQVWLSIDRSAPADNCDWFIGGHVDYYFGSDYFFSTAAGLDGTSFGNVPRWNTVSNSLYGFSMPQLYAETDYGTDTKIKWGHFFTIIGYEVVPAIGNFFYSHSYTMQYGEPFTHTGMLASQTENNWTFYGGMTSGWNTFDADDRAGFLGGITYTDKDWGSLAVAVTTGDDSELNLPGVGPFANRTMYSLVWSRDFTSRFTYVLQHDWGTQNDAVTFRGSGAQWYGINQYLFYKLNCCWTAGVRAEWFRDDDGFVVTGLRPGNAIAGASFPGNFYEVTAGLNYKPNSNLSIRPEVRWDWYDGQTNQNPFVAATLPYDAGSRSNQFTYGVDLVYQW